MELRSNFLGRLSRDWFSTRFSHFLQKENAKQQHANPCIPRFPDSKVRVGGPLSAPYRSPVGSLSLLWRLPSDPLSGFLSIPVRFPIDDLALFSIVSRINGEFCSVPLPRPFHSLTAPVRLPFGPLGSRGDWRKLDPTFLKKTRLKKFGLKP